MKKGFITLVILYLLTLGFLGTAQSQELVKWVPYEGSLPVNVVYGGQENGAKLAVCRCEYNGAKHAGKVIAGKCNFGWGGMEITRGSFDVLINPYNTALSWVSISGSPMVSNAVISGTEDGENLYVGKANYGNGVHPGKVFWNGSRFICNIGYGGKELTMEDFKVLVTGQSEAPAQQASAQCVLYSPHWNINGNFLSLKEDGKLTVFKGQELGTWQCTNTNSVRLNFNNGQYADFSFNTDGTMTAYDGGTPIMAKPMTKEEKEAMKMATQVDDALNKLFNKKN